MKCLAAFYLMKKGWFGRLPRFKEIKYIPLPDGINDYITAWQEALKVAESLEFKKPLYGFDLIEKIEIYTLGSSETYVALMKP